MKILLKAGIIITALFIQLTILNSFTIQGVKPDLILLVVLIFSLLKGTEEGILSGFTSGLLQDVFSTGLLGVNALVKTVIGFISGNFKEKIFPEHLLFLIPIITLVVSISQSMLTLLILHAFGIEYGMAWSLKKIVLSEALYNSLLSPFVFLGINKVFQLMKE